MSSVDGLHGANIAVGSYGVVERKGGGMRGVGKGSRRMRIWANCVEQIIYRGVEMWILISQMFG